MRRRLITGLVVIVVLQEAVVPQLRVLGAFPDLIAGFVAVAGLTGGSERGAVVGFLAGMGEGLFLQGPFGMSAFVYTLVGFAAGVIGTGTSVSSSRISLSFATAAASAVAVIGYALVGALLGQTQLLTSSLGRTVGIVSAVNFVLGVPLAALARWSLPDREPGNATQRVLQR